VKGETLKALRVAKGLTQGELGKLVGVQHNTISEIENGKRGLHHSKWPALASALGISVSEILSDEPLDEPTARLLAAFADLPPEDRIAVLNHAEALVRTAKLRELAK
jgi:transcriptional regulator with XRE-family HTH domain